MYIYLCVFHRYTHGSIEQPVVIYTHGFKATVIHFNFVLIDGVYSCVNFLTLCNLMRVKYEGICHVPFVHLIMFGPAFSIRRAYFV